MRRFLLSMAVVALAAAVVVPAASAQVPTQDSVTGEAFVGPGFGTFVGIDAKSGPSGENPTGFVSLDVCVAGIVSRDCFQGGGVTCMNVHGNRAVIGYYGSLILGFPNAVRNRGFVEVIDTGPSSPSRDTFITNPHTLFINLTPGAPNPDDVPFTTCPRELGLSGGGLPGFSGQLPPPPNAQNCPVCVANDPNNPQDFVVTDAQPPLPNTKDQCKQGGWQQFGFKNQGQCVAFVERGPKG
jgi:hypothetical protein